MKNISLWARHHAPLAIILIIVVRLVLFLLACTIGLAFYQLGWLLPAPVINWSVFMITALTVTCYPAKRELYTRRKCCDFLLPLYSCIVVITMANNANNYTGNSMAYGIDKVKKTTAAEILQSGKTRKELTRKEKRILKKEFFKQLKIAAAAKLTGDQKTSGKAWKIALAIIAMVGLLYLLAALACSLSCNGSDAAAIIVSVFGVGAIVVCFVLLMKRIHRGPPQKTTPTNE